MQTRAPRRRRTVWARTSVNPTLSTAAGTFTFDPLVDMPGGAVLGCTVTRIRGMVIATNSTLIGLGVLGFVVSAATNLANADAPLSGATGREDDWMGYVPFSYRPAANSPEVVTFDIKAQRRLDEFGMKLIGFLDVGALASTTGVSVVVSTLITLP